ncbi:MAG: 6-carboxytetrahydropterin synthase [Phycisphaerales bacterium]|nr:6-carboxytetrahydropterin synthase [Phycisphaerales bacterium]
MIRLSRTIRFCVNPGATGATPTHGLNGYAGRPPMQGLGRYYELHASVLGHVQPVTGYLVSIKTIDEAARASAVPIVMQACAETPTIDPASLLPEMFGSLAQALPPEAQLAELRFALTPTYSVSIEASDMTKAILRQQFDFAASHRLNAPELSAEENKRVFGRCNNPNGHGHNYRVEPAVEVDVPAPGEQSALTLQQLEQITLEAIIDRYDHTHLNYDTPEFGEGTLNPSVENMAKVFFHALEPRVKDLSSGRAHLRSLTVWETDRTSSTYPADAIFSKSRPAPV